MLVHNDSVPLDGSLITVTFSLTSEETVGEINLPLTVTLTKKEAIMRKVKLIVHETYQGKRKSEDVDAAVFLSNVAASTPNTHSGIIKDTERSQDSLCSEKGAVYGTSEE